MKYCICIARMVSGITLACIFLPDTMQVFNLITGVEIDPSQLIQNEVEPITPMGVATGSPVKYLGKPQFNRHMVGSKALSQF
jgi:hypothetical protein